MVPMGFRLMISINLTMQTQYQQCLLEFSSILSENFQEFEKQELRDTVMKEEQRILADCRSQVMLYAMQCQYMQLMITHKQQNHGREKGEQQMKDDCTMRRENIKQEPIEYHQKQDFGIIRGIIHATVYLNSIQYFCGNQNAINSKPIFTVHLKVQNYENSLQGVISLQEVWTLGGIQKQHIRCKCKTEVIVFQFQHI